MESVRDRRMDVAIVLLQQIVRSLLRQVVERRPTRRKEGRRLNEKYCGVHHLLALISLPRQQEATVVDLNGKFSNYLFALSPLTKQNFLNSSKLGRTCC